MVSKKTLNTTLQMGGQGFTIYKTKTFTFNFLGFLSCCVKLLVETLVQISLFFIPSESIVALVNDTGRKTFAQWFCMILY